MFKFLIVSLLVVGSQVYGAPTNDDAHDMTGIFGYNVRAEMKMLSDYLEAATPSKEPEENFKLTHVHYKEELRQGADPNSKVMEAMRLFVALETINESSDKCNEKNINIIEQNDGATSNKARRIETTTGTQARTVAVFARVAAQLSNDCIKVYEATLEEALSKMDKAQVSLVDQLQDSVIEEYTTDKFPANEGKSQVERLDNIVNWLVDPMQVLLSAKHAYETLKELSKDDPDSKYLKPIPQPNSAAIVYDNEQVQKLFTKYLVEPCQYYDLHLYKNLFQFHEISGKFGELDESKPDFYKTWVKDRLCKNFIFRADTVYYSTLNYLYQHKH